MMTTKYPYTVRCAGCDMRRAFMTGGALATWVQGHRCWLSQPTALSRYVAAFSAPMPQGVSDA